MSALKAVIPVIISALILWAPMNVAVHKDIH